MLEGSLSLGEAVSECGLQEREDTRVRGDLARSRHADEVWDGETSALDVEEHLVALRSRRHCLVEVFLALVAGECGYRVHLWSFLSLGRAV